MSDGSAIEWTEATWQPITGCTIVSPGCTNCYAMRLAGTRLKHHSSRAGLTRESKAGPMWTGEVRFNEQWLDQPLRWKRPRLIFVCAHGDLFHESVPDEWIDRVFAVMALASQHTFQVLTKRAARMRSYFWTERRAKIVFATSERDYGRQWYDRDAAAEMDDNWPMPNVWLGVSAERQQEADERIAHLVETPAAVRWMSAEPLLGPIDLTCINRAGVVQGHSALQDRGLGKIDWLVAGGESGPNSRPMHPDWARSLREQCAAQGVEFFFKQWGEWGPGAEFQADISARRVYRGEFQTLQIEGSREIKLCIPTHDDDRLGPALTLEKFGKKIAGRLLDGVEHNAMPKRAA